MGQDISWRAHDKVGLLSPSSPSGVWDGNRVEDGRCSVYWGTGVEQDLPSCQGPLSSFHDLTGAGGPRGSSEATWALSPTTLLLKAKSSPYQEVTLTKRSRGARPTPALAEGEQAPLLELQEPTWSSAWPRALFRENPACFTTFS